MPLEQTREQYLARAAKARELAAEATTASARSIHNEIAEDYETKAASLFDRVATDGETGATETSRMKDLAVSPPSRKPPEAR